MIPVRKIWSADHKELGRTHFSPLLSESCDTCFQDLYSRTTANSTTTSRGYFLTNIVMIIATSITVTLIIYVGPGQTDQTFHVMQNII